MGRPPKLPYVEPLTVIIPARNAENTILRAIDSACNSGATRVLVFDDASTDKTFEILSDTFERECYPQLEYFSVGETRSGVVFARNYLIENADYGLIIPLDADDVLHPITELKLEWQEGTFTYGNYILHENGNSQVITAPPGGTLNRKNLCNATMLFHKSDWEKVGGYDVDFAFAEDYALQCAFVNAGILPRQTDRILFERFLHPTGNERTALATAYWQFYRDMARRKYPGAFLGSG